MACPSPNAVFCKNCSVKCTKCLNCTTDGTATGPLCPARVYPTMNPPKDIASMLADVFTPFPATASNICPLNLTGNNQPQYCYYNELNGATPFISGLLETDVFGVMQDTFLPGPTNCDQYYLTPPYDLPNQASNVEFIIAPPDSSGNPQCSYFDNNGPNQCTTPMCDCTTRCLYDGALPCVAGTNPVKVGPCLSHPSWNGWTMQGFQCQSNAYSCNISSGKCEPNSKGDYKDIATCQKNCTACPNIGFVVAKDNTGTPSCYRVPFAPSWGDMGHDTGYCAVSGDNACLGQTGMISGWETDCPWVCDDNDYCLYKASCTDKLTTPVGGYYCTATGYQKCTTPGGCTDNTVNVWQLPAPPNQNPCVLPNNQTICNQHVSSSSSSYSLKNQSVWFQ